MTTTKSHTTYRTKRVIDLSDSDYEACWSNTLISEGLTAASMRPRLEKIRANLIEDGWATILRDANTKEFLGWTLTFVNNGYTHGAMFGEYLAYYYVPPTHRRKGYGRKLAQIVKRKFPKAKVVPWDDRSRKFFDAVNATSLSPW